MSNPPKTKGSLATFVAGRFVDAFRELFGKISRYSIYMMLLNSAKWQGMMDNIGNRQAGVHIVHVNPRVLLREFPRGRYHN